MKVIRHACLIILFSLLLNACSYSSTPSLKLGLSHYEVVEVEGDYESIYFLIDRKIQQCFVDRRTLTFDKNIYRAIKMGEFGISDADGFILLIELIASENNNTMIGVYINHSDWLKYRYRIEGWLDGTDTGC